MTRDFAMGIKAGGDPRALPDYRTLCIEMARLGHPACPDVDWRTIEQCCLALFASNGVDLQTAAAYALARSRLAGLDGMYEGLGVLETLLRADAQPWPRGVSARTEILNGLFASWQAVLRELEIDVCDLAALDFFNVQLEHVRLTLLEQIPVPIISLEGLRTQVAQRVSLIERDAQAAVLVAPNAMPPLPMHARTHSPTQRNPAATQPTSIPIRPDAKKCPAMWIGLLIGGLLGLLAALAWL
ncbi:type VI secretion system ImpA family N-terminal domain-containing protein [Pseudomonas sp. KU26590]|uniref:type VI secretion system ImpA family N-terminal domain-containing protein n=1 Tax=Pseudomonas sp. KU26590 TaxID=2991051 RepID=UPI00223D9AD9|nr:type VI secretion system ImpA family N-terminal domain-containing protein [Pseudomonas sp. KU26590]UZJ62660.1 type VI secretion system ImpA family N-terminal domain-containing protein [Pseudomonas sp. KU26590]